MATTSVTKPVGNSKLIALTGAANTLTSAAITDSVITVSHTAASVLTLPESTSVDWRVGTKLTVIQLGAGSVTIAKTGSDTIAGTTVTGAIGQSIELVKTTATGWQGTATAAAPNLRATTGTAEAILATDAPGSTITTNNAAPVTVTIVESTAHDFPIGTQFTLINLGAGDLDVEKTGSDTIVGTLVVAVQYDSLTITKISATGWHSQSHITA